MKSIVLTTVLALGLAAPAFAASQLELSLGVPSGVYSNAELAEMLTKRHLDPANERAVNFADAANFSTSFASRANHSAPARAIFANIRAESLQDE